jgi:hypothetical protein
MRSANCRFAAPGFIGTSMPKPEPVKSQEFTTTRNTSAKASVTSAKYEPRSP